MARQFTFCFFEFRLSSEIVPFMWIAAVVVQFLFARAVADVTPALGADAVVVRLPENGS
jgi:hypothetical protein